MAVGLGCLQYVLDRGQELDWFNSGTIVAFGLVAAICLISLVPWEWRNAHPVVDVRLFSRGSFSAVIVLMLVLGVALYGTTVLLPVFEQVLMGYTAEQAGMTLSPGGFVVILLLPLVGFLMSRVDVRLLIGFGLTALAAALFFLAGHLYVGIDFKTAVLMRCYQMTGMAFLFVPINSVAYADTPPEKSNEVSGLMNVSRNIGGSVGIAFVTTFIARHAQMHQTALANHTNLFNREFTSRLQGMARAFEQMGASSLNATHQAMAALYRQMMMQATQLAYLDAIRVLGFAVACTLPLLLLVHAPKPGASVPIGH